MTSIEAAQQQIQSQLEKNSTMSFEIPPDIYNDILYLQKTLRHHIQVHQVCSYFRANNARFTFWF